MVSLHPIVIEMILYLYFICIYLYLYLFVFVSICVFICIAVFLAFPSPFLIEMELGLGVDAFITFVLFSFFISFSFSFLSFLNFFSIFVFLLSFLLHLWMRISFLSEVAARMQLRSWINANCTRSKSVFSSKSGSNGKWNNKIKPNSRRQKFYMKMKPSIVASKITKIIQFNNLCLKNHQNNPI